MFCVKKQPHAPENVPDACFLRSITSALVHIFCAQPCGRPAESLAHHGERLICQKIELPHQGDSCQTGFRTSPGGAEAAAASREGAGFRQTHQANRCPKPCHRQGEAVGAGSVDLALGDPVARRRSARLATGWRSVDALAFSGVPALVLMALRCPERGRHAPGAQRKAGCPGRGAAGSRVAGRIAPEAQRRAG